MSDEIGSPQWWINTLDRALTVRLARMQFYRDLVDGRHERPVSREVTQMFRRMAELSTTNLIGLAVEATAERMDVEGIRIGDDPDGDADAWGIWQASNFDVGSQDAVTAALIYGRSFVSVEPTPAGPLLHYEDPRGTIVAFNTRNERVAALKVFADEWTGQEFATLYLPNMVLRLAGEHPAGTTVPRDDVTGAVLPRAWVPRSGTEVAVPNPMGEVPIFELQNVPLGEIRSEIEPLITPQKLLNQTMFNIQAISEYGAFRQKWATGIEVPTDPVTGARVEPFNAHVSRLFTAEGPDAKFGDFNPTDMKPHIDLAREIAGHIARISRIPVTYFLTDVSNVGTDALALIVSGLVQKCRRRVKGYEPAFEDAIRLAFKTLGDARANEPRIEVKWAEMETRSKAQDADAAVKLTQGDNPVITPQTAQEKWLGMSPTERARDDAWRREGMGVENVAAILAAANAAPLIPPTAVQP